jgi:hypothetical protein
MDLGEGDYVIVRSPDGSRSWRYEGAGKADLGLSAEGFWGIHIAGDTAIIELWSAGEGGGFGYTIDRYARGFTREEFGEPDAIDGIIGVDDSEWAPCYETSDPVIYDRSRAVARLLITGTFACSGWLLGNEGHLMTNQHCIENQSQAWNTNYEFMAEGASCATNCGWWFACPGTIVSTTATMIGFSADYDYALVELPVNPTQAYGYFVLRETGGVVNERLYMPQHPQGWGKKVALYSSEPNDPGWPKVVTKNAGGCQGRPGPDMAYRADTQGGTSGSPVLGYSDNKVIALHHCGGSTFNTGVLIEQVIAGLGSDLPSTAFGVEGLIFENGFEVGGTLFWSNTVP